jgi:hypothetical protein
MRVVVLELVGWAKQQVGLLAQAMSGGLTELLEGSKTGKEGNTLCSSSFLRWLLLSSSEALLI